MLRCSALLYNELCIWLKQSPHAEICGLLAGSGSLLTHLYPVPNRAPNPARAFRMDPSGQIRALHQIEASGQRLMALIHSHPCGHGLRPGAEDRATAQWFGDIATVIAVAGWAGGLAGWRAYRGPVLAEEPILVLSALDQGA